MQLNSKRRIKGRHQRSGGAREVAGPNGEGARGKKTVVHTVPCCNQKATMQPPLKDTFCDARKVESPTSSCECKPKKTLWRHRLERMFSILRHFTGTAELAVMHREKIWLPARQDTNNTTTRKCHKYLGTIFASVQHLPQEMETNAPIKRTTSCHILTQC